MLDRTSEAIVSALDIIGLSPGLGWGTSVAKPTVLTAGRAVELSLIIGAVMFLTDDRLPTIEHMLNHIDYIADLVGWQHMAIGTDWPLQAPDDVPAATVACG